MKVAHVISSGGLFGAEKVLLSLAQGMAQDGVLPWVVALKNSHNPHLEIVEEAARMGLKTAVIDVRGRLDLGAVSRLRAFIVSEGIDIIHGHNYKANMIAALASRKTGVPMMATNHGVIKGDWKLSLYEALGGLVLRLHAKKVVVVSQAIKTDLVGFGVPPKKIEVVFNGIRTQLPEEEGVDLRGELKIASDALVIGVVARLSPEKGHSYFFKAVRELLKGYPDAVVLLVGEGSLKGQLEKSIEGTPLEKRVIFTGYRSDMPAVYKTLDILVQSSLGEGLSITLLEAMLRGKAVIATDVGASAELVKDRETGLLIRPGSSKELYEAMRLFAKDPDLRRRCGANAAELVRSRFTVEQMVGSYRKLYSEVILTRKKSTKI